MASLREHAKARTAQTALSRVDAETFRQAIARVHERFVAEGSEMPEHEMIAVVLYRVAEQGRLTEDELKRFGLLSRELKVSLLREALNLDETEEDGEDAE